MIKHDQCISIVMFHRLFMNAISLPDINENHTHNLEESMKTTSLDLSYPLLYSWHLNNICYLVLNFHF